MTNHYLRPIICTAVAIIIATATAIAAPQQSQSMRWEQIESVESEISEEINVSVRDNNIYVTVSRPTTVKLFTILGQPISQVTLQPGTARFRVNARGIYILKIGSATRRITI
ncbi:MAG: T9SS type A sorting domain-containing protein [Muribaculaceae bacterium]|nr:T9SS type A sorting domain-containing protein [Muribaculaceae bacterium]